MIVILNGSVGVGKTAVSWCLNERFEKSVMLDGDHIGAVHPFEIYDDARVDHLYKTLVHLTSFHRENGYSDFVINYVFENAATLAALVALLRPTDTNIHRFWITCSEIEQERRIRDRHTDQQEWELKRYKELNGILAESAKNGAIGARLDTTALSAEEAADAIWAELARIT